MRGALILTLAAGLTAQINPEDRQELIRKTRVFGAVYADQLRRFSASQHKVRTTASVNDRLKNKWKPLETQDADLDFDAGRLKYKLLRVDDSDKEPEKRIKKGYADSYGEFDAINVVFAPERMALLAWDHLEAGGACVLSFFVPQASSIFTMSSNASKLVFAYRGRVFVDCASGAISRVQLRTDPAKLKTGRREVPVGVELDVRYAPAQIAGETHLLPSQAVIIGQMDKTLTKAEMTFSGYRKYAADSSIIFDEP